MTGGGVYDEILPEPEGYPEGRAQGISRRLRYYPIPDNDILSLTFVISPEGQVVFSSVLAGQL